ncbi:hypothetical protein R1sor_023052 [Riccia sorocarpa]|uniref:Proton pump-interactor 1 n=1 Tax=Riccia sorocarpa TaxID=122646 RepID=A0ABD3GQI7_9MARC
MPPEVESGAHIHGNGNPAKSGLNGHVGDLPAVVTNGKINAQEATGKLNGILDVEDRPHQEAKAEGILSSSNASEEIGQMPRDQDDEAIEASVPSEDVVPVNGVTNGVTPSTVSDPYSDWTAPEGNSAWEVAGDVGVLGPDLAQEKAPEQKASGTPERYYFWMVKIPRPVDNKGKAEIRMAELRLKEKTEKRDFINAAMQMKKASRAEALDKLRAAREKARACTDAVRGKRDEMEPLRQADRRFKEAGWIARDRSRDLPATEQELDQKIAEIEFRIQHESIPLKEEKLLLREIKNLNACREEVCANAALHAEVTESLVERDEIQGRLKPMKVDYDTLKSEMTAAYERLKAAELEFKKVDEALAEIQGQYAAANRARQEAFDERSRIIRQDNARNDEFYQNRRDITNVRQLAFKKDKNAVAELCHAQVERILDMWNNNDEFRANYIKNNERSTLKRLETFDGRLLGPDEEPPLIPGDDESTAEPRTEAGVPSSNLRKGEVQSKSHAKSPESKPSASVTTRDFNKTEAEGHASDSVSDESLLPKKDTSVAAPAADASKAKQVEAERAAEAELKEQRRQQEMAKAKEAEERKKRMAERAQSKALIRAQKEAEKKEKEREKKAKKKAAAAAAAGQSSPQGASSSEETTAQVLQEVETSPEVSVKELHSESKPSSKQRKRAVAAQQKAAKTVKPLSVPSSLTKKDVPVYQQTWFLILLGIALLLGLFALIARFVL